MYVTLQMGSLLRTHCILICYALYSADGISVTTRVVSLNTLMVTQILFIRFYVGIGYLGQAHAWYSLSKLFVLVRVYNWHKFVAGVWKKEIFFCSAIGEGRMMEHMVPMFVNWFWLLFETAQSEHDLSVYSCSCSIPFCLSSEVSMSEGLCSCLP